MKSRHLLITGLNITILAVGCAPDQTADQRPRRRFEVTPPVLPESDRVAVVQTPRPVTPAEAPAPVPEQGANSVEAAQRKVQEAVRALEAAQAQAKTRVSPAPQQEASPVDWLNPDDLTLSTAPRPHRSIARASAPADPLPRDLSAAETAAADDGAAAANRGTQVAVPAPVSSSTLPSAPPLQQSGEPIFAAQHMGVVASAIEPMSLQKRVAESLREHPSDLSAHFDYQMLRFVNDERVPQLDAVSTLPSEDRELLSALMDGLSNFRTGIRAEKNMLLSKKVGPILDMADRLKAQAELTIPTMAICSRVQGFGVYDTMPTSFKAGTDNQIIIYCEVANFASHQNEKGIWETKLHQETALFTESGFNAWNEKSDIPADLSHIRRHDFFVLKKITLPKSLGVGRYVLKVSLFDEQVKRMAESGVQIQLLAQ